MKIFKNILAALALVVAAGSAQAQTPKYIFYYIGDGMGMGPVMAAQTYNRTVLGNSDPLLMMQFPVVAWCQTWSASNTTTDSAAAGTALSTGTKTRNGMLGMSPDTIPATSVATVLHNEGWGVGLNTSVGADDATPGAFYAHVPNRGMHRDIDLQYAQSGYEFLGGAGLSGLNGEHHDEILDAMNANGVQMLFGRDAIPAIDSRRVCLLNTEKGRVWDVGYTIDSLETRIDLPLMARTCLAHLEKHSPDHFFMMVEGGNIDHALHANDGATAIIEILNFDEALRVAYDFYLKHPDETLIVVTADHDTGGLAMGNNVVKYSSNFGALPYQSISKEEFSEECKAMLRDRSIYYWDDMRDKLSREFGLFNVIPVSEKQEQELKDKFTATFELRNSEDQKTLYANFDAFSVAVFKLVNDYIGFGFTSTSHTGNPVPCFAIGVGADNFKGLNNNNEIAPTLLRLVRGE